MKTNQLMDVAIGTDRIQIEHKSQMGNLKQVWEIGNTYRRAKGLAPKDMHAWLKSRDLMEYVMELEIKMFGESNIQLGEQRESAANQTSLVETRRGKHGGTWAHLYILIDAATYLDPKFKVEVYQTFIEGKILQHRDESGDAYIAMNIALDLTIPEVDRKARVTRYRMLANSIADAVGVPEGEKRWNRASYEQLEKRTKLEASVTMVLRIDIIKDFDHLLQTIPNLAS